jgi:hypothetical protein
MSLAMQYVDLDYSGNGEGEYMYYDRKNKEWNDEACQASESERCVRMDCHQPTSHFSLLGIFKEPDYGTFMKTLFKTQGDCVWTDEEYKMMQYNRDAWPQACTEADNGLYYDTKPGRGGTMGIGLYTDSQCIVDYEGDTTAEEVIVAMSNNDDDSNNKTDAEDLDKELAAWNNAFDAFKICQPCKASNLVATLNAGDGTNVNGDRYQHRDDGDDDDDGFSCADNAGVNQCAQFAANTNMLTASYRDVTLAEQQGTVKGLNIGGVEFAEPPAKLWVRDLLSVLFLLASVCFFVCALMRCQRETDDSDLKKPLVGNTRANRRHNSRQANNSSRRANE